MCDNSIFALFFDNVFCTYYSCFQSGVGGGQGDGGFLAFFVYYPLYVYVLNYILGFLWIYGVWLTAVFEFEGINEEEEPTVIEKSVFTGSRVA